MTFESELRAALVDAQARRIATKRRRLYATLLRKLQLRRGKHMQPSERLQGQDAMYADKRPNAKRITLDHVVDCIDGQPAFIRADKNGYNPEGPLTLCILPMRNGFFIVGKGATIDPEVEFDEALGEEAAYNHALTQVFEKEAYVAMELAWRAAHPAQAAPADKITEAFPGSETIAESPEDDVVNEIHTS